MNISPSTGKVKLVTADKVVAQRFKTFLASLIQYKDAFDIKAVGEKAEAVQDGIAELVTAIELEAMPKKQRPEETPPADEADGKGKKKTK